MGRGRFFGRRKGGSQQSPAKPKPRLKESPPQFVLPSPDPSVGAGFPGGVPGIEGDSGDWDLGEMIEFIRGMETADVGREVGLLDALPSEQMKEAWIAQIADPPTEEDLSEQAELQETVEERAIAQQIRDEATPFSPEERALAAFDAVEGRRDDEERLDRGRRAFGDEDQGLARSPGDYLLLPPQGNEPGGPMPQETFFGGRLEVRLRR